VKGSEAFSNLWRLQAGSRVCAAVCHRKIRWRLSANCECSSVFLPAILLSTSDLAIKTLQIYRLVFVQRWPGESLWRRWHRGATAVAHKVPHPLSAGRCVQSIRKHELMESVHSFAPIEYVVLEGSLLENLNVNYQVPLVRWYGLC
jgi:hypothetical protein